MHVVIAPDQRLRVKTKPVKKINHTVLELLRQMKKLTISYKDPEGVGLASTQIGRDEQLFIAKQKDNSFKAYLNPKILNYGKRKKMFFEGCLSIPNYWGEIERPSTVRVSYMDIEGKVHTESLKGVEAWIFQHEFDHLQGRLYMDHVMEQKAKLYKVVGRDKAGAEIFEQVPL